MAAHFPRAYQAHAVLGKLKGIYVPIALVAVCRLQVKFSSLF